MQTAPATQSASIAQPAAPSTGAQPDYSAQWAEYYRSLGKHKEAEAIEAQMKAKVTIIIYFIGDIMLHNQICFVQMYF